MEKQQLIKIATELNRVLKPEPKLNLTASDKLLTKQILQAASLLTPDDDLTKATAAGLKSLGWAPKPEQEPEPCIEPKPTKQTPAPKPKKEKAPKLTRIESTVAVLRTYSAKRIPVESLITEADKLYAERGGVSNPKESRAVVTQVLNTLTASGIVSRLEDNNIGVIKF